MAGRITPQGRHGLLGIYLNDHLAAATGAVGLIRRAAAAQHSEHARGVLQRLAPEIAEDRAALTEIMSALGVPVRGYKVWAGWAGEKAGRLKPNGYLRGRSPLSDLVELELLALGVHGKAAGWRTLQLLAGREQRLDARRLDDLLARAHRQAGELEELRASAASHVIETDQATMAGPGPGTG